MGDNKKIAVNSVIIFVRLCIVSLISIIVARLVLQALGASDYGLYSIVGGLVAVLNVLNTAMIATTYRYIAVELGKGIEGNPNLVFNTCFAIHILFGLAVLIIGLPLGEFYIENYLNVPEGSLDDAHFVFRVSIATTMVSTILVPFQGLLTAYERFSASAIIDICSQILRLVGVILLLRLHFDNKIRVYSLIMLVYTVVFSLSYMLYCRYHYKDTIRFKINKEKSLYREMLFFSGWILFGACASVGKTQGSAMIVNFFWGTLVNAAFAVANQIENFLLMFSKMLNNAAVPQIMKNYSGGNENRSVKLASYISKYTFFLMSLVAFPLLMEMDFVLSLWLKDVPEGSSSFCKLMVLGGLLGCIGEGIPALTQASGKIKYFQIVLSLINIAGLPVAFIAYKLGASQYAILEIYCLIYLISAFVRLFLLKRILNIDVSYFIKTSYLKMLWVSIPLIIAYYYYNPSSYGILGHIMGLIGSEILLLIVIFLFGSDSSERVLLRDYIKSKFHH